MGETGVRLLSLLLLLLLKLCNVLGGHTKPYTRNLKTTQGDTNTNLSFYDPSLTNRGVEAEGRFDQFFNLPRVTAPLLVKLGS